MNPRHIRDDNEWRGNYPHVDDQQREGDPRHRRDEEKYAEAAFVDRECLERHTEVLHSDGVAGQRRGQRGSRTHSYELEESEPEVDDEDRDSCRGLEPPDCQLDDSLIDLAGIE